MDNTILKFLLGEGELDGVWYGDKHPTEQGMFWWRKHLRQYLEQAQLQQPVVMQAEGSDGAEVAAVASEGEGEADMSGVELQPDEVCGCHYMTPVWAGSNQCMKCNKNRL